STPFSTPVAGLQAARSLYRALWHAVSVVASVPFVVPLSASGCMVETPDQRSAATLSPHTSLLPQSLADYDSQTFVRKPRLVAFSVTARLTWSETRSVNSAEISNVTRTSALGSAHNRLMISSASCTSRTLAVAAGTST